MSSHISYILCPTFVEYCYIASLSKSQRDLVPLIDRPGGWATQILSGNGEGPHRNEVIPFSRENFPDYGEEFRRRWEATSWSGRLELLASGTRLGGQSRELSGQQSPALTILVTEGPALVPAYVLAVTLNYPMRVARPDFGEVLRACDTHPREVYWLVSVADEADDKTLFGLLQSFEKALKSTVSWPELSLFTLLSARDLASLSWLVAKVIADAGNVGTGGRRRVTHFLPHHSGSNSRDLILEDGGGARATTVSRAELTPNGFMAETLSPRDALALPTHGFEACADGGAGVVLCGLKSQLPLIEDQGTGALACGLGYSCPRGPYPVPLEKVHSRLMMLGSCNGLRLGDSVLRSDFNLGLSFLDGYGLGYVSSLYCNVGSDICTLAFSAAMASGLSLAETAALINGLLSCAGIEHPCYIAIGNPLSRATGTLEPEEMVLTIDGHDLDVSVDFGPSNLGQLVLRGPFIVEWMRARRIVLQIDSSIEGDGIYWFHRPERMTPAAGSPSSASQAQIRLFIFRFPEQLGRIRISLRDGESVMVEAQNAFAGLRRWLEFWQLSGLSDDESELYQHLSEGEAKSSAGLAVCFGRLGFDGSAGQRLRGNQGTVAALATIARDCAVNWLSEQLPKPFWLTNIYAPEYRVEAVKTATCPNCHNLTILKQMRHTVKGDKRQAAICPRCGIVSDVCTDSDIKGLSIRAPRLVRRDERWELEVVAELSDREKATPTLVCPRISANGKCITLPDPPQLDLTLDELKAGSARFTFTVPQEVPPHRYFIKVVIATTDELAFASRPFFVR